MNSEEGARAAAVVTEQLWRLEQYVDHWVAVEGHIALERGEVSAEIVMDADPGFDALAERVAYDERIERAVFAYVRAPVESDTDGVGGDLAAGVA